MSPTLSALLQGCIDYAGLFPPANLNLHDAIRQFGEIRRSELKWILNRFVIPVGELDQLLPELQTLEAFEWPIAVLGSSLATLRDDLGAIAEFETKARKAAYVEGYEVKAQPSEVTPQSIAPFKNAEFVEMYIEMGAGEDAIEAMHLLTDVDLLGPKLRTGGLTADAFPSVETVALFLREAISLELPHKFTAGLHHPLFHHDETIGVMSHGFLNVLAAGVMMDVHSLSVEEIQKILTIDSISEFRFDEDTMMVGEWDASLTQIEDYRELNGAFGSCSVHEPLADLFHLGLLSEARA